MPPRRKVTPPSEPTGPKPFGGEQEAVDAAVHGVSNGVVKGATNGTVHLARPRPLGHRYAAFEREAARRMLTFGLDGWTFGFSRGKRTLGVTKIPWGASVGEIRLSKYLIENDHASLREETLLHEIAHAVAFVRFGRRSIGHGPLWRQVATEVGASPSATCRTEPIAEPSLRWTCDRCGHVVGLFRTPKYAPSTYRHRGCGGRFLAPEDDRSPTR